MHPLIRNKKLIPQTEASRLLNVSQAYISMVLSGKRKGPKAEVLLLRIKKLYKDRFEM